MGGINQAIDQIRDALPQNDQPKVDEDAIKAVDEGDQVPVVVPLPLQP
jgi:hypothetical protein